VKRERISVSISSRVVMTGRKCENFLNYALFHAKRVDYGESGHADKF
jgi:hypothetical protein